jgi:hypothetical protein
MTKKVKAFWIKMSFWLKLKASIAVFGVGSEISLFIGDSHDAWKWVAGIATALGLLITIIMEDKDNNGHVDLFE